MHLWYSFIVTKLESKAMAAGTNDITGFDLGKNSEQNHFRP